MAIPALQKLGAENDFIVDTTKVAATFNLPNLEQYQAVVFLNTSGVLDNGQQPAFEQYTKAGHGFVGIHAATATEYNWPWYNELMGAYFSQHPTIQVATTTVVDKNHGATTSLPTTCRRTDEWYNFGDLRLGSQVLADLDEQSYAGGKHGSSRSIAWYHAYQGGPFAPRAATPTKATRPLFWQHLLGGIRYAAGSSDRVLPPSTKLTYVWNNLLRLSRELQIQEADMGQEWT